MPAKVCAAAVIQGDRERQEDYHRFYPVPAGGAVLAVLADGMGGHPGGAEAAKTAVDAFVNSYAAAQTETSPVPALSEEMTNAANAAVANEAKKNKHLAGMGCTLIAALIRKSEMQWISIGDSLLYLFSGGRLQKLNEEHSFGVALDKAAREGRTTPEEASQHPMRHALYSVVTGDEIRLVDTGKIGFESDDALIVAASDGLLSLARGEAEDCLRSVQSRGAAAAADELIGRVEARNAPGQDNTTVLIIEPGLLA